jgi:hypothetical protein
MLVLVLVQPLRGQSDPIFPINSGQELLDLLVQNYKPSQTLSLPDARDTLYARIYHLPGDSLSCVYTGYTIYVDPALDPSQAAFAGNINLEHTYPQAMGAQSGLAASDMHALHPSRVDVNNARGNLPFLELDDAQTNAWFYLDGTFNNPPLNNRERYSRVQYQHAFEPRDDHKGNIARAYFYFFTMYKAQALQANPDFFETQRPTLCQWHAEDPVDEAEYTRSHRIAGYQSGLPNPFVLDCTLAQRSYCPELDLVCQPVSSMEVRIPEALPIRIGPNPVASSWWIDVDVPSSGNLELRLTHSSGGGSQTLWQGAAHPGQQRWQFERPGAPGVWIVQVLWQNSLGSQQWGVARLVVL